jgi:butyrate kinase
MDKRLILAVNPGSTSTKFALFEEDKLIFEKSLSHSQADLAGYDKITEQLQFRKNLILNELSGKNKLQERIRVVVGRGGLIMPIESGVYKVNRKMLEDLSSGCFGQHASNLGGLIADEIASSLPSAEAYIVDPVVVDELEDVARISGHPSISRRSIFHALNQKAVARIYASSVGKKYEELNLIIAHMGGGISVGAHKGGRVIDVNNALDGDGPFSPERSGGLPAGQLAELCFSGKYSHSEISSMITGKGGMVAYLGTNNFKDVCSLAENGNEKALLIRRSVTYQVAKEIGAMASVLHGSVDAVILTGGMAYQESAVSEIRSMVKYIADVIVYPGEDEMKSLAFNALLALDGKLDIREY